MDQKAATPVKKPAHKAHRNEVYVLRGWKEYMGESLLIIFSVLLALFLTEYITNLHEKKQTREILHNIREELVKNREAETIEHAYEAKILTRIDSVLVSADLQQKIVANDEFHFKMIAPAGAQCRDLNTVAWDVAKSQSITNKANFELLSKLTDIYDNQARITKLEDQIAKILLAYDSRKLANVRTTLLLVRDSYHGWSYDRAQSLLKKYDEAIKMIDDDKL
ncbi:hypothetical protein BEL04_02510 [Mucilaginibacter sp. PPCGB 2223]|uniref:hypothetical protein n=1 Tax=Mucilaginibacter sp. PPCGB 2223 TaxID=1886027 RepID=UPI00082415BA|nr:hypothetical protein [Mucilaginibacter sp. PPCGB 2223]OCX53202.1 hypothetical protein BEL04_02510 [Mucilaginibacter sp. PPCGB 2223]